MSQARLLAIAFIVVGALLALISAFADQIGFGAPGSTFGWKQLLGTVLGAILLVAGVILLRQPDQPYDDEEYAEGEEDEDQQEVAAATEATTTAEAAPGGPLAGDEPETPSEDRRQLEVTDADRLADDVTDADADRTGWRA